LVFRRAQKVFEFIELKINSNQPLFAVIEIIGYGMIHHFTRNHLSDLGYSNSDKEILEASQIHLKVSAPCNYYTKYDLKWLKDIPDKGLADSHSSRN
jgi:hypothetical protein